MPQGRKKQNKTKQNPGLKPGKQHPPESGLQNCKGRLASCPEEQGSLWCFGDTIKMYLLISPTEDAKKYANFY